MQKVVHNLMMIVVLYHVLVGCCWHHAHDATSDCHADESLASICCEHGRERHADHESSSGCPQPHEDECDSGKCFFVVPQTDSVAEMVAHVGATDVGLLETTLPVLSNFGRESYEAPPPIGTLPLRLHLFKQVLLI